MKSLPDAYIQNWTTGIQAWDIWILLVFDGASIKFIQYYDEESL